MKNSATSVALITVTLSALIACSGDTDAGQAGDPGYRDDVFVSTSDTTGAITVEVQETDIDIGDTSGFIVVARNADGRGVPNINIACDSERGVAIIEPTTGREHTDANGHMSGRIGCERPGSFEFLCRLTVGANKRAFVTVKCRGEVPNDFQGFPGAAGGGLGGGVAVTNDGEVRITSIGLQDTGSSTDISTDASVDVVQDACGDEPDTTPEPFFDTYVAMQVENNLRETVSFSYVEYDVPNANRTGRTFSSQRLGVTGFAGSSLAANGDSQTIVLPVFKAFGGSKYFGNAPGSGDSGLEIASNLGLRTVTFTLVGQTGSGEPISVSGSLTASFSNFDKCGS